MPHPRREATVFNESLTSIKQTGSQPYQVKGIRDPRVTHPANMPAHHATIPRVDTIHPADAALTAGTTAIVPHLTVTGLVTATLRPGNGQWTPNQPTPMQSPAQKMPKLKSIIQRVPAYQHFPKPLYKSLRKDPKVFIQYLQGSLDRKAYDTVIQSMAVFHNSATVACRVIACTMTALVAATRGIRFMALVIPMDLMNTPNNPSNAELPGPPARSEDYQSDVWIHCVREWAYLLKLLQYWHDANSLYEYSGPVWTEGNLMLFALFHVNEMLNPENLYIWLHEIMNGMPWRSHYFENHSKEDREVYFADHINIIQGLEHRRNWIKKQYLAKARETWHHLKDTQQRHRPHAVPVIL